MDLNLIDELCTEMSSIRIRVSKNRLTTPGSMNIAEIMNRHHLENQHSNILGFLLNPFEKHHHPEFGDYFLKLLKSKGLNLKGNKISYVKREDSTDEARRIDLFLETDRDCIIIENKIFAEDQANQVSDYLTFLEERKNENSVFIVYLSPFGKDPTEKSICPEDLLYLKKQQRYVALSYSVDILDWLNNLKIKECESVLQAGIIQYIDIVKAITNQRKEVFDMNQEIAKELLSVYGALSREELKEKMITLYEFQNNINLVLFINFFEDIFKESNGKMLLICNGNEYQNLLEWKDSVIQCQVKFGVRYHCEDEVLDLFVRDLSSNKFVFASKNKELSGFGKI